MQNFWLMHLKSFEDVFFVFNQLARVPWQQKLTPDANGIDRNAKVFEDFKSYCT